MILQDFHSIRPPYETAQEKTLDWLIEAHCLAEGLATGLPVDDFRKMLTEKFWHVGCKPDRIAKRGHILSDYLHQNWSEMEVYKVQESPIGSDLGVRMKHYQEHADQILKEYYPEGARAPDDLIHVSCTGYASPSAAQKLVSLRNWGEKTTVTHAYHMGCYGALAAIRIGEGYLSAGKEQVDLVHTELCSLHSNPSLHRLDQLVSQSLFADGYMKYSLKPNSKEPHLSLLALREEVVPDSTRAMTWNVLNWGFEMTLGKEVPVLIARSIKGYLERLSKKAGRSLDEVIEKGLFAIHPGGPKILVHIQELLGLTDWQMGYSFDVLRNYGNMSSATLPHAWQAILKDPEIEEGTLIASMAFGPGLTISGGLMEKRACG